METIKLKPGDDHYTAYVGRPEQYDFMGATQFRLLTTLGLRQNHALVDFGCGSLRAGKFFISYLDIGNYYAVEPNKKLLEEGFKYNIGNSLLEIKKPIFSNNEDFSLGFDRKFDFIIAQSIFSHTGLDLAKPLLKNFSNSISNDGIIAATFVEGINEYQGNGWVYPECVYYKRTTVKKMAREVGLYLTRIPWYHPTQTWYLLSKNKRSLPGYFKKRYLAGAVLNDPELIPSWKPIPLFINNVKKFLRGAASPKIMNILKKYF